MDFLDNARCLGNTDVDFFPSDVTGMIVARRFCLGCDVRQACLDYAVENEIKHGMWGGVSENKRKILVARLRNAK